MRTTSEISIIQWSELESVEQAYRRVRSTNSQMREKQLMICARRMKIYTLSGNIFNIHVAQKKKKLSRDSSGYARMCDTRECRSSQSERRSIKSQRRRPISSRAINKVMINIYTRRWMTYMTYISLSRELTATGKQFLQSFAFCNASSSRCVSLLVFCVWELVLFALSSR